MISMIAFLSVTSHKYALMISKDMCMPVNAMPTDVIDKVCIDIPSIFSYACWL